MADLNADYWTMADIADHLGVTLGTVHAYRRRTRQGKPEGLPAEDRIKGRRPVWIPATIVDWSRSTSAQDSASNTSVPERLTAQQFFDVIGDGRADSAADEARMQKLGADLARAFAPRYEVINRGVVQVLAPQLEALTKALKEPFAQLERQLFQALMPSTRHAAEQIRGALIASVPRLDATRLLSTVPPVLSGHVLPAYRTLIHTPPPTRDAEPLLEVARSLGEATIKEIVLEVLRESDVREAIQEVAEEASTEESERAPHVAWAIAIGAAFGIPIPAAVAVALDPTVHPVIDTAVTTIALAVAILAVFMGLNKRS